MSIEKLIDSSKIYVERSPYVQILNNIVEHIKDNDAFRLYCYLSSKSRNWQVAKEWTAKQCDVAQRKSKQCWSYLERCGLLEYKINRDDKGRITSHDVVMLNGTRFNPHEPFLKQKEANNSPISSTGADSAPVDVHRCNYPPTGQSTRVGFAPQLNKDLNEKKDIKLNKEKSFYKDQKIDNQKRHDFAESMDQMASEKKHIEEHEKIKKVTVSEETKGMIHELALKLRKSC